VKLFILGAGGQARETFFHLRDIHPDLDVVFVDDVTPVTSLTLGGRQWPVLKNWEDVAAERTRGRQTFTLAVGAPAGKRILVERALRAGLSPAPTWVHTSAVVQDARLGVGGLIAPGVVVTCNVQLGDYVLLNFNACVGHDAVIGDYATVGPGAVLAGNVSLGADVVVGAGAVVRERTSVAAGVTIGAQACVVKDVAEENAVVAGVPAKSR
jgi:sugar O-acyltransferase (sialic acid O-acetyltransferase NeuD family)